MEIKTLHEENGLRTLILVLKTGDEVMECLEIAAIRERLSGAQISAIGAFESAELFFFDWERKEYEPILVEEQVEVAALMGDIAIDAEGKPALHVHVVLGRRDGTALAGHLSRAEVRPTLEIVITETPAHLRRRKDPETGLALINL